MKSNVTPIFKFKPIKLQFLRERYGCSLRELAQKINYSTTTISKWEKGKSVPSNEIVAKLATIFNVHDNFFFSTGVIPNFSGTVFFRKGAVLPKRNEIEAKSQARLFAMVDQKITLDYGLRGYESYGIEEKNTQFQVLDKEEIKQKAIDLRNLLQLGDGPINDMTHVAERMGIRVMFSDLDSEKIDAITCWVNDQPYIILNSRRLSSVRIRFNLAHEIGHIILHSKYPQEIVNNTALHKTIEHEANQFAGEFLIPDRSLALDMDRTNMQYLIELKRKWKISLQALIYRGEEIGLISSRQALFLRQTIYRNNWRINEPLDKSIPIEYPKFYNSVFNFLKIDVNQLVKKISSETGLKTEDIFSMLGKSEINKKDHLVMKIIK